MLRSALHGSAPLEVQDGFQFDPDIEDSFVWLIDLIDRACDPMRAAGRRIASWSYVS